MCTCMYVCMSVCVCAYMYIYTLVIPHLASFADQIIRDVVVHINRVFRPKGKPADNKERDGWVGLEATDR